MAFLKVASLGGEIKEYFVADNTPLLSYLRSQGHSTEGVKVELNSVVADEATAVTTDGVAVLTSAVKGG